MAWLQKRGGVWWIGWRLNGKEYRKSTRQRIEADAKKHLEQINALEAARSISALTTDFVEAATGKKNQKITASKFFADWLKSSESVTSMSTMNKYRQVVREFSLYSEMETKGLMIEEISVENIAGFLAHSGERLAANSVKGYRRILSSIFLLAQNRGLIKANPVALAKERGKKSHAMAEQKRPFTLAELKTLFDRANDFWKFMIVAGFFSGQSLGDLITMRTESVDLGQNIITMRRRKTGKQVIIPLSKTLRHHLESVWPKDAGYFWPDEAERYLKTGASSFSQEFFELMASVGLVTVRDKKKKKSGAGRNFKRKSEKLGFHNIRHTFVTHLKIGGAVDSVARELAGHSSNAVSAVYTHLPNYILSRAIERLPEF